MPMPRVIGVSLACLVTSACAVAKTPEKETPHYPGYPGESSGVTTGKSDTPDRGILNSPCREGDKGGPADDAFERAVRRRSSFEFIADGCRDGGPCRARVRAAKGSEFGKAAWYDLVGRRTASGEILDRVTATAAHRSLPLASLAKVTDLDNGRSVIVKINDRGPFTRGRIIDLSPRAADTLDMKAAGVAAVVIEPMPSPVETTVAAFQTRAAATGRRCYDPAGLFTGQKIRAATSISFFQGSSATGPRVSRPRMISSRDEAPSGSCPVSAARVADSASSP
jgi:rare lipoprotein A